ncbi:hypothetical protein E3N88_37799 [Mikania micrantha]|uniref:Integrase catalytic domain-containing protein n=1 Tax=Mikania micrantha TaxID=192012 RepID=A0A5N6LUG7_9ASTR|nr:hypothetical protein E3N88_37799 [Mikania micrantha]
MFRANRLLELVYVDVCGTITPTTKGGNRYMLLLVDDHSRYMWEFIIKSKDEVFDCLERFKSHIELETGCTIRKLRMDNGGEFTSKRLAELCNKAGIQHQYTYCSILPTAKWGSGEAKQNCVEHDQEYLKGNEPSPRPLGKRYKALHLHPKQNDHQGSNEHNPYEIHKGMKPNLEHIKMVHLRTQPGTKAYRMFNPVTGKVHVTRDVQFDESGGWIREETKEESRVKDHTWTSFCSSTKAWLMTPQLQWKKPMMTSVKGLKALDELDDVDLMLADDDPKNYLEERDVKEWQQAMEAEITSFEKNHTWSLTNLPEGAKPIGLKWELAEEFCDIAPNEVISQPPAEQKSARKRPLIMVRHQLPHVHRRYTIRALEVCVVLLVQVYVVIFMDFGDHLPNTYRILV